MKRYRLHIAFVALFALPLLADACPLCQAGATKKTQKAYEETTAILALIPIIGGGGIFYWIYSKVKKNEDEDKQGMA